MADDRDRPGEDADAPARSARDPASVLPRLIEARAREHPTRPFLVEAEGRTLSYAQVVAATGRWRAHLDALGVGPGMPVASLLPPSIDAYLLWLAAASLGALEVPVNPELRGQFLRHVLTDAGARLCFARPGDVATLAGSGVEGLTIITVPDEGLDLTAVDPIPARAACAPDDIATMLYTSGTTGPAKGVLVRWGQLSSIIGRLPRQWLSHEDVAYAPWPMFHITGRSPLMSMADVGGRVVLRDRFSVGTFWSDIRRHGCTTTTIGYVLGLLLAAPEDEDDGDNPLRTCLVATPTAQAFEVARRFRFSLVGSYGSTEVGFPVVNRSQAAADVGWAGHVRPGYEARIVDEHGTDVEPGAVGELWVRPEVESMIFAGYLGRPELTAASTAGGWYRTGDSFVQRADGALRFVDRMRDTIRRFGENISATALESAVLELPDVAECAVMGVPSPVAGQEVFLVAVARTGCTLEPARVAAALGERIPRHMRPSFITIVSELPKAPSGKVLKDGLDRAELLARAWRAGRGPAPDATTTGDAS